MATDPITAISIRELAAEALAEREREYERQQAEYQREREAEREAARQLVISKLEVLAGGKVGEFNRHNVQGYGAISLVEAPHLKLFEWCGILRAEVHPSYERRTIHTLADLGAAIELSEQIYRGK